METVYADKLYEFLTEMAATAQSHGDDGAVQRIDKARRYFRPPVTSEFLGESMLALREVLERSGSLFTLKQTSKATEYADAIKQQWFSPR